jgi:hypothetical protein
MAATTARPSVVPQKGLESFQQHLNKSTRILALLGAGLSASSGLPTFRGAGGLWRTHDATSLATPEAFARDPGLVWQFYSYRRHMALSVKPNPAHYALAELAKKRNFLTLSQNVDGRLSYCSNFERSLTRQVYHHVPNILQTSSSSCMAHSSTSSAQISSVTTPRRITIPIQLSLHWLFPPTNQTPPPTQPLQLESSTFLTRTLQSPSLIMTIFRSARSASVVSCALALYGSTRDCQVTCWRMRTTGSVKMTLISSWSLAQARKFILRPATWTSRDAGVQESPSSTWTRATLQLAACILAIGSFKAMLLRSCPSCWQA